MAYGMQCKNCGYQQTEHENRLFFDKDFGGQIYKVAPGFKKSLNDCPGFEYTQNDFNEAVKMQKIEEELGHTDFPSIV